MYNTKYFNLITKEIWSFNITKCLSSYDKKYQNNDNRQEILQILQEE